MASTTQNMARQASRLFGQLLKLLEKKKIPRRQFGEKISAIQAAIANTEAGKTFELMVTMLERKKLNKEEFAEQINNLQARMEAGQ